MLITQQAINLIRQPKSKSQNSTIQPVLQIEDYSLKESNTQIITDQPIYMQYQFQFKSIRVTLNDGEKTQSTYFVLNAANLIQQCAQNLEFALIRLLEWTTKIDSHMIIIVITDFELIKSIPTLIRSSNQENKKTIKLKKTENKLDQSISIQQQSPTHQPTHNYTMINEINLKSQKWIIQARIIQKFQICDYFKSNVQQNYFKIIIMDQYRSTIGVIFFDQACDKYYDMLMLDQVYTFKNGQIQINPYDQSIGLIFDKYAIIQPSQQHQIPQYPLFSICSIKEMNMMNLNTIVDLMGVVIEANIEAKRQQIEVYDESQRIKVNLVGQIYTNMEFKKGDILQVKNLKLGTFNNKQQLSSTSNTMIFHKYINKRAEQLHEWQMKNPNYYEHLEDQLNRRNYSLKELQETAMEMINENKTNQELIAEIPVFLMELAQQMKVYPSCPQPKCLKKAIYNETIHNYSCPTCQAYLVEPHYRYLMKIRLSDYSDSLNATLYDELACKLFGSIIIIQISYIEINANEFNKMSEIQQNQWLLIYLFQERLVKITTKFKSPNGIEQPVFDIIDITDIDSRNENKKLYQQLFK